MLLREEENLCFICEWIKEIEKQLNEFKNINKDHGKDILMPSLFNGSCWIKSSPIALPNSATCASLDRKYCSNVFYSSIYFINSFVYFAVLLIGPQGWSCHCHMQPLGSSEQNYQITLEMNWVWSIAIQKRHAKFDDMKYFNNQWFLRENERERDMRDIYRMSSYEHSW